MTPISTGNATIDGLLFATVRAGRPVIASVEDQRDALLLALQLVAEPSTGFTLSKLSPVTILATSAVALSQLSYASFAAYVAARAAPDFVHTEDTDLVNEHNTAGSTATYEARFKRGDNGQYRRLRVQGFSFVLGGESFRAAWSRVP